MNYQRCDFSADGTKLLFAYGYGTQAGFATSGSTPGGAVHVAIGDISSNPLIPSFTIETAKANTSNWDSGTTVQIAASFKGGNTANVFWLSDEDPTTGLATSGVGNLFHSERTGTGAWSSPDWLFNSTDYPGLFTSPTVMAFDLLNAFTGGVGILLEVYDTTTGLNYLGYSGPSVAPPTRKNNFAFAGGPSVSKGSYASA